MVGDNIIHKIEQEISEIDFAIIILLERYMLSEYHLKELDLIVSYKKEIFPISIDSSLKKPWKLKDIKILSYDEDSYYNAIEELVNALN